MIITLLGIGAVCDSNNDNAVKVQNDSIRDSSSDAWVYLLLL